MRKRFYRRKALRLLSAAALFFCLTAVNFAQSTAEELESFPPEAMSQVVPRILKWYFKPRRKLTEIRLAARGIRPEWLPEIRNIEFVLVSEDRLEDDGDVFFFQYQDSQNGRYEIGFAYGDPDCSAVGDTWYFRVSPPKVRLWKPRGVGFGSGCAVGDRNVEEAFSS